MPCPQAKQQCSREHKLIGLVVYRIIDGRKCVTKAARALEIVAGMVVGDFVTTALQRQNLQSRPLGKFSNPIDAQAAGTTRLITFDVLARRVEQRRKSRAGSGV